MQNAFPLLEKKSGRVSFWWTPAALHLWSVVTVFVRERERERAGAGQEKKIENQYVVNVDIVVGRHK